MAGSVARPVVAAVGAAAFVAAASAVIVDAHKPVTSKYTFADVLPIVRRHCAPCHAPGQAAPMSLLTYQDALPWAESIRQELVAESMPPWFNDPAGPPIKRSHTLTAAELDTIVTWAAGGTPEGMRAAAEPPPSAPPTWTSGPPDLVLEPASAYSIGADVQEATHEFLLESPIAEPRWVRSADLLPGDPSIVRDATVAVRGGATLLAWVPGERPAFPPDGARFRLPAHAQVTLRIHYRKTWRDERKPKSDNSRVGLYLEPVSAAPKEIRTLSADDTLAGAATVLAVRQSLDKPYALVEVRATPSSGAGIVLLRLHNARPGWSRRYWLDKPLDLPAGVRLSIATAPALAGPDDPPVGADGPLMAAVDFVVR